ncbi:histidine kinase [Paenibacillus sp. TRM 82003]|nr:histidine kinase [Paenibacillus sp. TRM 82003]
MNRTNVFFIITTLITICVLIYYYDRALERPTVVSQGSIDLSKTDFNEKGVVALDGEWEFYWEQFLYPSDFETSERRELQYMDVPGNWLRDLAGNTYDPKGYATFRLKIHNIPNGKYFGLKKENIRNASRIYVNGELLIEDGRISESLKGSLAGNSSKTVYFEHTDSSAEIIVWAANHEYIVGGIAKPILFGTQDGLIQLQNYKILFEFSMILIVLIIGIFYVFLWIVNKHYRKREPVTLPLALSCLSFGIMNGIYSERVITLFYPELTLNLTFRFGHFMSAFSMMMVWIVINKVNPMFISDRMRNVLLGFYGSFMAFVLTLPLEIYTGTLTFYMVTTVFLFLLVWTRVVMMFFKARSSSVEHRTLIISVFSIFLYWLDMTLYSLGMKSNMFLSFLSISVYSIALAALLIVRYTNSYKKNEELSIQLIETFSTLDQTAKEAQRNELAFLQAQIKPHFLFNALSSIISLCYTNGERAGKLLADLSNYLKRSFHIDLNADYVTIENELKLIKAYVDIEKARFEDRIEVVYEVDEEALSFKIIPLVIEPLVENAIRHGVLKNKSGGKVKLTIKKQEGFIFIGVEDNGKGMAHEQLASMQEMEGYSERTKGNGVSLVNIHARLQTFYDARLRFETNEKGTKAYFSVPVSPARGE